MDVTSMFETAKPVVIAFALKVVGAIVLYIIGRWLIGMVGTLITQGARAAEDRADDRPLHRQHASAIALNVLLVIGILGYFGVETTSFAALIAALGIAIGAAWGGLLSNFAAGVFILVLRPFKVGDYVLAGEVEGTVRAIGLFTTVDRHARQRAHDGGQRQGHERHDQELSAQPVPPRGPDRAARSHRRSPAMRSAG